MKNVNKIDTNPMAVDGLSPLLKKCNYGDNADISAVSGGLFNYVYKVQEGDRSIYIKRFTDTAKSPEFPPLPTTAYERFTVASLVHRHAAATHIKDANVYAPSLIEADADLCAVAMEAAFGSPLYDFLLQPSMRTSARQAGLRVMAWLRHFHDTPCQKAAVIGNASEKFKAYKANLQYTALLDLLPLVCRGKAERHLQQHLDDTETLLHGDINSRNVIVCTDHSIAIIDFEQGQMANPSYDIAYLVSEYVIAAIRAREDPQNLVEAFWLAYAKWPCSGQQWKTFRRHLAFQVLYRLHGPSRSIWTGHLDAIENKHVAAWSHQQFIDWL